MAVVDKVRAAALAGRVGAHVLRERWGPSVRPTEAHEVPPSSEGLTRQWLTAVLCAGVPGARVESVELGRGSSGTSTRRAVSVGYNRSGRDAGLPTRLYTKSTPTFASRLLLGLTDIAEGEALFYSRLRPQLDIRSPRAFGASFDPHTYRSMLLLEDLAERDWIFPNPMANPVTRRDADDLVAELATYHGTFWRGRTNAGDFSQLQHAQTWQENLNRKVGFEKRTLVGFDRAREVIPPELFSRRDELYPAFMRSLALHRQAPETLLHQDLHLGNWLRDDHGRMGLYDWQCVARGHWALDYSYAVSACLDTDDRRAWERDLLAQYLDGLARAGADDPPSFDDAWLAYRQHPLHAFVFGVYTLGGTRFEPELQPRDYTLHASGRIARAVNDLGTLDALNRTARA